MCYSSVSLSVFSMCFPTLVLQKTVSMLSELIVLKTVMVVMVMVVWRWLWWGDGGGGRRGDGDRSGDDHDGV